MGGSPSLLVRVGLCQFIDLDHNILAQFHLKTWVVVLIEHLNSLIAVAWPCCVRPMLYFAVDWPKTTLHSASHWLCRLSIDSKTFGSCLHYSLHAHISLSTLDPVYPLVAITVPIAWHFSSCSHQSCALTPTNVVVPPPLHLQSPVLHCHLLLTALGFSPFFCVCYLMVSCQSIYFLCPSQCSPTSVIVPIDTISQPRM